MQIKVNDNVVLEVLDSHEDDTTNKPVILFITGLGQQICHWPKLFMKELSLQGFRVIQFDNRDVGYSSDMTASSYFTMMYNVFRVLLFQAPPYTLTDMANDARGLLDALKIEKAHVVGWSMGGMISQRLALEYPDRVLSLTLMMTSSGSSKPEKHANAAILSRPKSRNKNDLIDHLVYIQKVIGSPKYPETDQEILLREEESVNKTIKASKQQGLGVVRQYLAIKLDSHRRHVIHNIKHKTLVIHGDADPLVPLSFGKDIANKVQNSKLVTYEGMGHNFPKDLVPEMIKEIREHIVNA